MGLGTLKVPAKLHAKNRSRLCESLKNNSQYKSGSYVVLQGGEDQTRYCSDTGIVFRQVCVYLFVLLLIRTVFL